MQIDLYECGPMVLDALIKIKNEKDPSLTFRRSRIRGFVVHVLNIDGDDGLACLTKIQAHREAAGIVALNDGRYEDVVAAVEETAFCKAFARRDGFSKYLLSIRVIMLIWGNRHSTFHF